MKFKNKGHEFDDIGPILAENVKKTNKVYIYGAGIVGKRFLKSLQAFNFEALFIDSNKSKHSEKIDGVAVISLDDYLNNRNDGMIAIAVSGTFRDEIETLLQRNKLQHLIDYFFYEEFAIVKAYADNTVWVDQCQISLTERCTLKCRNCAHACYAVDMKSEDMHFDEAVFSVDCFFKKVDFVSEFLLIGGEPLLYKDLDRIISYIGKQYRQKIGILSITTNGTLIPNDRVLCVSKEFQVLYRISNYSVALPEICKKHTALTEKLNVWGINYALGNPETEWMDYGLTGLPRKESVEETLKLFDVCKTPCREIRGSKYYYCIMARSVSENLGLNVGANDYIDINNLSENHVNELFEYNLGFSEKGYLDMCKRCNGYSGINRTVIPAAVQVD